MNVQAIVLPYYGIGDFLSNLIFINALLKKFPKDKFIIFTKPRTKAKNLLSNEKNVKVFFIDDSITNLESVNDKSVVCLFANWGYGNNDNDIFKNINSDYFDEEIY